jgi:Thioredoxin-like
MRAVLPYLAIALTLLLGVSAPQAIFAQEVNGEASVGSETPADPEASPFDERADASGLVTAALSRAARSGKRVIIVMGANWCHDSRALAGWFKSPRFTAMLEPKYEIVYVDVGMPQTGAGRNLDIVKPFNGKSVKNTPYVMLISPQGILLNRKDARSWRNAGSRSEELIYDYFSNFSG